MISTFAIDKESEIPVAYRGTPIDLFLRYHNLGRPFDAYQQAELLIGMCMDSRKHLTIPENFAFIIRAGGANLRYSEFKVSYSIGVGGVKAIALVGHDQCGMSHLGERKDIFVNGLVERAGWTREEAEHHFMAMAPVHEIGDERQFIMSEAERLRKRYPKIIVAPLIYRIADNRLYGLAET